ncbi:precorrin-4 C(11)-methyltransferase [Sulfodiicoccus acidiphilus]|uniref:Precorrin-4 C(11)-methyltransferase n=1 Tax=Sulfodiicoccus acidiphilus TaxID=1670455 RepID=A0A348B2M9_9CREN|nr:precorrin-4 C(11)-methyltransferase [Sulfodiicoccus acidiphilus]GGT97178.1 precorrin-4 C(11)-methyltransferase [Sulfodiicoccus acidiphilus]
MVFVGAGPGDPELITVKGRNYLEDADVVLYAGSLVNREILKYARREAEIIDTASLTQEEISRIMVERAKEGKLVVRVKSGDFSIYGALMEELWSLQDAGIDYELVPGITAALGAASALGIELTLPKISQTVIITRASVAVPMEGSLRDFAPLVNKGACLAIYTGIHVVEKVVRELREAGLADDTPVAIVYKATWPEQLSFKCRLSELVNQVRKRKISKDSIILVGKVVEPEKYKGEVRSSVYDPSHAHTFRPRKAPKRTR